MQKERYRFEQDVAAHQEAFFRHLEAEIEAEIYSGISWTLATLGLSTLIRGTVTSATAVRIARAEQLMERAVRAANAGRTTIYTLNRAADVLAKQQGLRNTLQTLGSLGVTTGVAVHDNAALAERDFATAAIAGLGAMSGSVDSSLIQSITDLASTATAATKNVLDRYAEFADYVPKIAFDLHRDTVNRLYAKLKDDLAACACSN